MPNMDLEVDTSQILQKSNSAQSILTEALDARLNAMRNAVAELDGFWEGPNHDTFLKTFDMRYQALHNFNCVLGSYLVAMQRAQSDYDECESNVAQYVK